MKKNKVLFMLPTILIFLLSSLFPVFKLLIDVKNIENIYLSFGVITYLLIFILVAIIIVIEVFYLINYIFNSNDIHIFKKILLIFILLIFNILVIPYIYMKYVLKENNLIHKSLLYIIPVILFSVVLLFGIHIYNNDMKEIKEERKRIEEERNDYKTKDGIASFTFRHGYKVSEVGEYDLYVINKTKNIIFSSFTYDLEKYEQKNPDDYINREITTLSQNKEKFEKLKDKETITKDDLNITTIEYVGKTSESSLCVYKISTITFNSKPNYLVEVVEIVTYNNYELYGKELTEILESAKIN